MNERRRNLIVGGTVLAGLAGFVFLLLVFGYLPRLLQTGYQVEIELEDAVGVNPGSRVDLAGIDVGEVESISFRQPFDGGVLVAARIKDTMDIPASAVVVVEKELLGGSSTLKFVVAGNGQAISDFLPRDGTARVVGGPGALANAFGGFQQMGEDFTRLSAEWSGVGAKLNTFLGGQTDPDAVGPMGGVMRVITQLEARLVEIELVVAGMDSFVNDPQLREDIAATGANARKFTADASASLADIKGRTLAAVGELSKVLAGAEEALTKANAGEGTMGKTMNDPALYDNLNDAALRMGTTLDDLRLLLDKWKAEGVPISF